jgi:hypothetical protein
LGLVRDHHGFTATRRGLPGSDTPDFVRCAWLRTTSRRRER